jgi:hypothetical protein
MTYICASQKMQFLPMKKIFTLFILLACFGFEANAQTVTRLIGSSPFQDSLWVFDTTNFNIIRRIGPTPSSGGSLTGTNGIAMNQSTGQIFVVCKQSAVTGRVLGILNPLTGLVTIVGNLGDNFASITFNGNNTLLGVTGDGATVPETVYRIDQANANKTVLRTMGNGADGEVICYNATDNMIYHWSGNGTIVYEKMDTSGVTVTGIPIIGTTNGETFGACFIGNNKFITSNISSRFQNFYANGTVTAQYGATSPDDIRGTALLTCSRAITGNQDFCVGSSTALTFGSAGAANYQWYLNGSPIAAATNQIYNASQPGHYNCIVSDACGTDSLGAGIDVFEHPLPLVTVTGPQSVICPNSTVHLQGALESSMQWYLNGSPIPGQTLDTLNATGPGYYNQLAATSFGCLDSAAVGFTLTAVPDPVIALGNDTAFCTGNSLTLDAGNAGSTFMWSPSGNTSQTELISTTGMYAVTVTTTNGCSASDSLMLTINQLPVVNIGNDTATCGTPVMLDAGNPGSTYLWCDGSTTQIVSLSSSGTCAVQVTDANGCVNSDTITITVNPLPSVTLTSPGDSLCPAQPAITLTPSPVGGTLTGPGLSGNSFTPINAGPGTHTITYMYTDVNGCSASDSVMITVFAIPNISVTSSASTVCIDDADVQLTGSPVGGTFSGTGVTGSAFDPTIGGLGSDLITYIFTDTNGCNTATTTTVDVNACVGINEQLVSNGASIYPNPTSGEVQISVNINSIVTIFNALGENVMALQLTEGNHAVDLNNLAEGIYFIRTQNANGISTQRLIIHK